MTNGTGGGFSRAAGMGMLAVSMARGRVARTAAAQERARAAVAERLGSLRGLPQKIGQVAALGAIADASQPFHSLSEGPPVLDYSAFVAACEAEWGRHSSAYFRTIAGVGVAASLAQVHRAETTDGRDAAIKLLLPGIEAAVWNDLRALGWLTAPIGGLGNGFDLGAYRAEVKSILEGELDLTREAEAMRRFAAISAGHPWLVVPAPIDEATRTRVMAMTWIDGERFDAVRHWSEAERKAVLERLIEIFLRGCLEWRMLHGDPHPGNLRFRRDDAGITIGILDFGCVKTVSPNESAALGRLVATAGALRPAECLDLLVACGFRDDLLEPMAAKLPAALGALFEPFRANAPYAVAYWRLGERIEAALGDDRWNFRIAGPSSLLVMVRAFQGLIQYAKALAVPVNWRAILERVADDAPAADVPIRPPHSGSTAAARRLCIRVMESGLTKAQVTFQADAVGRLDELVPDDLRRRLEERGVDPDALGREAAANGMPPGELFALDDGAKRIRVWLE